MHHRLTIILRHFRTMPSATRIIIGGLLIVGGLLGLLPILGFWMVPLGLLVLSLDFRWARRGYLSILLWFRHRRKSRTQPPARSNKKTSRNSKSTK